MNSIGDALPFLRICDIFRSRRKLFLQICSGDLRENSRTCYACSFNALYFRCFLVNYQDDRVFLEVEERVGICSLSHGVAFDRGENFFLFWVDIKGKAMKPTRAVISSSLVFLVLALAPPFVSAQLFKCVDADGKVTYSNEGGGAKGCKQLSSEQTVSTISMRANPSPATFPRVSDQTQKERDKARRQVLEKELEDEQLALEEAREKLAEQQSVRYGDEKNYQRVLDRLQSYKDTVERRERNIEALTQELSELR